MDISISARRLAYRVAYRVLSVVWRVARVRPDGVKCVIIDGESLLLVRHTYGPGGWDLPGGATRPGELPAATAAREMAEELGVQLAAWRDLGELQSLKGSHRVWVLGTEVTAPALRTDPVELAEAAWFHRDALPAETAPLLWPVLHGAAAAAFLAGRDRTPDARRSGAATGARDDRPTAPGLS